MPQRTELLNDDAPPQSTNHPSPPTQPNSNSWIPFQILLAIALTAALTLFAVWASSLFKSHRRRHQPQPPTSATELSIIAPLSRTPTTAGDGAEDGRNGHGHLEGGNANDSDTPPPTTGHKSSNGIGDGVPSQRDGDATAPARPPRAYPRRAEEHVDGMSPVEGVEMV